jgi:tRNA1Val (adenine37-N6)-methyltransferase
MSRQSKHFHFKQFSVRHDAATMKVGTDGVLLGAWVDVQHANRILDIGTGSGLIALMLAQRSSPQTIIDAVEVEEADAALALENAQQSPWPEKIKIYHTRIQQFQTVLRYDLIVSNPPYFNNSQEPPDQRRIETRHTTLLSHHDLVQSVLRLLSPEGNFSVILPYAEGLLFKELAIDAGLHCSRQWSFRTRAQKPIERWLFNFSRRAMPPDNGEILLYNEHNDWSLEYRILGRDFYLKM